MTISGTKFAANPFTSLVLTMVPSTAWSLTFITVVLTEVVICCSKEAEQIVEQRPQLLDFVALDKGLD